MNISIAIVVYKPKLNLLEEVLLKLLNATFSQGEIKLFIIDNSCYIKIYEKIAKLIDSFKDGAQNLSIQLIKSPANIGYGRANNLILEQIQSDYHLVLNPDVFIEADTLNKAIEYMQNNQEIGLLSPSIFFENGDRQWLCKRNPTLLIMFLRSFAPQFIKKLFRKYIDHYEMKDKNPEREFKDIPFPTGCFMFFRTNIFKELKGFDPKFFMYYEDADIGRRLLKISHSAYVPSVKIVHQWARGTHNNWRLRWITIKSGLFYFRKWGGIF